METVKIVWPRIVLGYAIAPLIVPLVYFIFAAVTGRNYGATELVGTLLNYGPYAYLFALVLGIPAVWLLRRSGHTGVLWYAVVAGAIGLVGAALLSAIGLKVEGVVVGTLAGAVFYLVAFA